MTVKIYAQPEWNHYKRYLKINEETNEITLVGNTLITNDDSGLNPITHVVKVVKAFPEETGSKGIWFGTSYDESKDEWLAAIILCQWNNIDFSKGKSYKDYAFNA